MEYLVEPCLDEMDRARAVFRWLAENIEFDTYFLETGIKRGNNAEDVIRRGTAEPEGYANAFNLLSR